MRAGAVGVNPELGNAWDSRAPGLEGSEAFMVCVAGWAPSGVLHECTLPTQVGAAGITLLFTSTETEAWPGEAAEP